MRHLGRALMALSVLALRSGGVDAQQHFQRFPSWQPVELRSSFSPGETSSAPDSMRVRVGYQHWRGAALGGGIGLVVGALAGAIIVANTECDDCSDEVTPGEGALVVGTLGAGAGVVLGFLAGLASPKYAWVPEDEAER
ncbi:MAG: hypothetical protein H0V43_00990 [Gemmatimonadales bacterium]|nr:hypothetical protein [Gemmatimonadales bacterium]MBA3553421.1 hypothetical protein [Gemmatimonadales bacterium]